MKDLKKEFDTVTKTGKISFGSKQVFSALLNGNLKLLLTSKNCPNGMLDEISYNARLINVPHFALDSTSAELGSLCGKPFPITVLGIMDEGESSILDIVKKGESRKKVKKSSIRKKRK